MDKNVAKVVIEAEGHTRRVCRTFCFMLEDQYLVDIAICCGGVTIHAHKCILVANSNYFREYLEDKSVEQVVIRGLDFMVIKSLIEYMYSGECVLAIENLKYFIAAVNYFKIVGLYAVFSEDEYQNFGAHEVCIPPPQFTCIPPKNSTDYKLFINTSLPPKINYARKNIDGQHTLKQKLVINKAEKSCAKEAQLNITKHVMNNKEVEVMFHTPEGSYILSNLSHENGHFGEIIQELKGLHSDTIPDSTCDENLNEEEPNFSSADYNEDLYDNSFHMQNAMFDSELMGDSPILGNEILLGSGMNTLKNFDDLDEDTLKK